jgi:hypothetical protein
MAGQRRAQPAAGFDGYSWVRKAISLRGSDPEMEFGAALITLRGSDSAHQEHTRKAMAGAKSDPLLARNLGSNFNRQTTAELLTAMPGKSQQ